MRIIAVILLALAAGSASQDLTPSPVIAAPTWTSIYNGAFAAKGPSGCAAIDCHGSASNAAYVVSNFACPNRDDCYASVTGASHLVRPEDAANPAGAQLLHSIRQAGNKGRMPLGNTFTFQPDDITRIEAWIAAGAKND